jgi:hypothetical protein
LRVLAIGLCAALVAVAVGASAASARGLTTGFTDNSIFDPSAPPSVHPQEWLDKAVSARAGLVRITVDWRNRLRGIPKHPTNPNDPAYGFNDLDQAVKNATKAGLDVVLTVYRAPAWAEGANPPANVQPGAWKPDPVKYGQFAQALATRYSGHYHGLPRVRYFEVWTEPNLTQFLAPQWVGKKEYSPSLYRRLLNSFYLGVHKAQLDATVIAGAMSPFGDSRKHQRYPDHPRMHPLAFLRSVLCLNGKLKRDKDCEGTAHLDAVSAHPLNIRKPPNYKPHSKDDTQVANFGSIRKIVRAAKRAKTIGPGGNPELWVTEAGEVSDPPNPAGPSLNKHARWVEQSLYLLWKQGAKVVINLNIRDPAFDPNRPAAAQFTSGIYQHNDKPKPAVRSFQFPFVTHRKSKGKVKAWGKAPIAGKLKIQQQRHHHWKTRKRLKVKAGEIFTPSLHVKGRAKLRARVGKAKSVTWRQSG